MMMTIMSRIVYTVEIIISGIHQRSIQITHPLIAWKMIWLLVQLSS